MSNATKPSGSSYELPHFSPEDLHATLDYLAGVLPMRIRFTGSGWRILGEWLTSRA
jgi:hypothetical protein